ncbi:MAG: hypothetical protein HY452_02910 [Parcubacteria group bacterium]|nr:hypothetical protein [Parcubacteria group bacterium]
MFDQTLKNFPKQFEWQPQIENADKLTLKERFIVLGMGGSHLAADVVKTWPAYAERLTVYSDYGLPAVLESDLKQSLIIAVSHSGNTEEVIDGFNLAQEKGLSVAAISCGGKLIELAQKSSASYVLTPNPNIQPRLALGFHFRSILKIMGEEKTLDETRELADTLKPAEFEYKGRELAEKIKGRIPIIYSSAKKSALAQIWKVKLNETAKTPAFSNALPEANHNEMIGFAGSSLSDELKEKFFFIFLEDDYDQPQNQKRLKATADLYQNNGFEVEKIKLAGLNHWHKIFSNLMLADWVSYHLAELNGVDPEQVVLVEEFKKKIQ